MGAAQVVSHWTIALKQKHRRWWIGYAMTAILLRHDALREALADLLHAVCGEKGFAEAVRRDSGRVYPWPALELAEAKALAALGQSK